MWKKAGGERFTFANTRKECFEGKDGIGLVTEPIFHTRVICKTYHAE